MTFSAAFRCIAGCHGTHPLDTIIYRCPNCGDLLEVAHDMEALASRPAAAWKELFEGRWRSVRFPDTSGVWGNFARHALPMPPHRLPQRAGVLVVTTLPFQ